MTSTNPDLQALLDTLAASAHDEEAAMADNYRFEERVGAQRQQDYETGLSLPLAVMEDWQFQHDKLHLVNRIKGKGNQFIPDTFLLNNADTQLSGFAVNQELVRIESLVFPFKNKMLSPNPFARLGELLAKRHESEAAAMLDKFIEAWNKARDNWPMFSAIYDDVREDVEHADWPHRLRDRLGLEQYQGSPDERIPVALMRYPARLAQESGKNDKKYDGRVAAAYALPTALDGELNRAYFPAPKGHPYGATLNLAEPWQPVLSAEILNLRIDYQPDHLWKIGEIVRPAGYRDLRFQRDQHLALLRRETGNSAYGQLLMGRS